MICVKFEFQIYCKKNQIKQFKNEKYIFLLKKMTKLDINL